MTEKEATTSNITEIIFSIRPVDNICFICICPLENTIALGGVEIGIINAQLEAIAMGIESNSGSIPSPEAIPIATGMYMVARATLLMSSVSRSIDPIIIR